jgi:glycosyltransferase involved in cell wall biosynthesis
MAIVGEGPSRSDLLRLIDRYELADRVFLLGYRDDVGALLRQSDVYVNPTIDEGFGIAVVEAMLSGVPVVLSQSGAHPELVSRGRFGLMFPERDSRKMADAIDRLLRSPELSRVLAERARRSAKVRFSPEIFTSRYLTAVSRLTAPEHR